MKRIFALLLIFIMLALTCGCNSKEADSAQSEFQKGDSCSLLTDAKWEGSDGQCVNVISFKKDNGFANWCYCGSPVGDGDVAEKFSFRAKDNSVLLYDCDNINFETGKILYLDKAYLIIDLWSKVLCYENLNAYRPQIHGQASENMNPDDLTWPCLTALSYKDGKFTVSDYNYDGDAAASFKKWELEASEDITFKSVEVKDDKGNVTVNSATLSETDIQHIGEYFTVGYFDINRDGKVQAVTFYGELIIQ